MELTTSSLFVLLFLVFLISNYLIKSGSRSNITGPNFVEVLLNLHLFGTVQFHKLLARWAKRYGKIYTFNLFGKRFVVVNTPSLMKTAFNVEERTQNPPLNAFEVYSGGVFGIGSNKHKGWLDQRKFAVQSLKHYGFRGDGTASNNALLAKDMDDLIVSIAENGSNPVDGESLQLPVINLIWRITTSTKLDKKHLPLFLRFQKNFADYSYSTVQNTLGPLQAYLGLESNLLKDYRKSSQEFWEIQQEIINDHTSKLEGRTEPEDYVDSFLLKMQDAKSKGTTFEGEIGRKNLRSCLMDMNVAGSNTVSHTFQYVILYMATHPEAQDKLRKQLDSVIGSNRSPVLEDRNSLPYFEAFILEALRHFSPASIVPHESVEDSKIEEYFIPKGSTVVANIWYINHDESLWEDPMSFKPERFLDASGEKVEKSDLVMSFSAGRHKCPGYLIGQDILFLLTTRVVQRFNVKEHPDHPITSLEPTMNFFLTAPNFKVLFEDRLGRS